MRSHPVAPIASRRTLVVVALLVGAALLGAGCGARTEPQGPGRARPFNLMLDFFPNADHAGIYMALAQGRFAQAGLDVHPQIPSDPSAPLKLLAAGRADMAISYEPELLLARDKGLALMSVGALVQRPLTSIIALGPTHITTPAQLGGKRVGTAGIPYQSAMLQTAVSAAHAPAAHEVNVGFDLVPAMLSRRVDATLGGFWNYEGIQLGLAHRPATVIPVDRAGIPTYDELVLVVREDEVRHRGPEIRAFLQALSEGENAVRADPSRAAATLVAANHDLDPRLQLGSIHHSISAFFPTEAGRPFGYADPRVWQTFGQWMYDHRLLTRPPDAASALTNEFLPGQGI